LKGKTSIIAIGALALITFALVAGVLAAAQKKTPVVVAARALEAGTKLSLADVEVVQVHAGAAQEGAFETVEDVVGLVTTVQRMPGDQLTAAMIGDAAQNALAQALDPNHRAVAIHVDQASGLAGLLRPGDTVSAVGIVDPSMLGGMNDLATGAGAKVMLSGLKVLFVPYEFRYREIVEDAEAGGMSPVMSSSAGRDEGVIILSVPLDPITVTWQISTPIAVDVPVIGKDEPAISPTSAITSTEGVTKTTPAWGNKPEKDGKTTTVANPNPTLRVSPVELLALLDSQATIYLAMEPVEVYDKPQTPGVYLIDLVPDTAQNVPLDEENAYGGWQ
jgi:hypothetical protein